MRLRFLGGPSGLFAVGFLVSCMSSQAGLMTFTDRTAFESATRDLTNVSFEGIVPTDSAQKFEDPVGLMTGGFVFRTSGRPRRLRLCDRLWCRGR